MLPDLVRDDVFRLETRRLWLRWPEARDAAAMAREAGRRGVADFSLHLPRPLPEGAAAEFILTSRRANARGERLALAIALKDRPAEVVGAIEATPSKRGDLLRVHFWLAQDVQGRGLMTEALRGFSNFVFAFTDALSLEAYAPDLQAAAQRVLEKANFAPLGTDLIPAASVGGLVEARRFELDRSRWSNGRLAKVDEAGRIGRVKGALKPNLMAGR